MTRFFNLSLLRLICLWPLVAHAGHEFACTDYTGRKVFLVGSNGEVLWEYETGACNDLWVLPNGNLLFNTFNGVVEITRDKKVVFQYTGSPVRSAVKQKDGRVREEEKPSEIYACQRLPNGNTFIGECNSGRLLEVAPDGKTILREVRTLPHGKNGGHGYMRNARCLPNGNYLCCLYADEVVREYDPHGKIVREIPAPGGPHSAARLSNGHTLISVGDKRKTPARIETGLFEVDGAGKIVWRYSNDDLPNAPLKFMAGFHRLPNGNTVMSNWLGHGHLGKAPHLFEVTAEKKVVWSYENHKDMKTVSSVVILAHAAGAIH